MLGQACLDNIFFKPYQIIRNSGVRVCIHFDKFRFFILIWEFIQGYHASTLKVNSIKLHLITKGFWYPVARQDFQKLFILLSFSFTCGGQKVLFSKYLLFFTCPLQFILVMKIDDILLT